MTEKLEISEAEYRSLTLPSYSSLKKLDDSGPRSINRKYTFDSEAIDFGSLLDCKLLCPEEFDNKFYFDATEKPTAQTLALADALFEDLDKNNLPKSAYLYFQQDLSIIFDTISDLNIFGSIKDLDKIQAKFDNSLFWNYIQAKINATGKTVFTPDTLEECSQAEQILKTHPKTEHLFNPTKHQEVLNQLMIITEIDGISVKVMMDKKDRKSVV